MLSVLLSCNDMDMGRVIAIQPIYANPTQPNPTHNVPVKIQPNPNQPNPTHGWTQPMSMSGVSYY